jgi:uncharacterized protein YggE
MRFVLTSLALLAAIAFTAPAFACELHSSHQSAKVGTSSDGQQSVVSTPAPAPTGTKG